MKIKLFIKLLILITLSFSCKNKFQNKSEQENNIKVDYLNEEKNDFDNRMSWWREARFGMFIHWGVYAVPAGIHNGKKIKGIGEWIQRNAKISIKEYEKYAKKFNPVNYDPSEWVKIMKTAGMKYVVITSKHHDGFALWDSKVSDYDAVDFAPIGKDLLKGLSEACRKEGIKFGLYHSIMDWHHPQAQGNDEPRYDYQNVSNPDFPIYYEDFLKPQLKELINNYDPDILWFDGEWINDYKHNMGLDLYQYIRGLKPEILINNRVDKGRNGMAGMTKDDKKYAGDFGTPEQEILEGTSSMDWESCMTMNDTWGFKSYDENWKSAKVLVHNLIDITSKGGNYLLNVGPTASGLIPDPSITRLEKMGEWLEINGEAIYSSEKLKNYKQGEHLRFTKKKNSNSYFAIALKKPENSITIKNIEPNENSLIYVLGYDEPLIWSFDTEKGLKIQVPESIPGEMAWTFKISGKEN